MRDFKIPTSFPSSFWNPKTSTRSTLPSTCSRGLVDAWLEPDPDPFIGPTVSATAEAFNHSVALILQYLVERDGVVKDGEGLSCLFLSVQEHFHGLPVKSHNALDRSAPSYRASIQWENTAASPIRVKPRPMPHLSGEYKDIIAVVNKCDEKMAEKGQWSNEQDWIDFWETANKKAN